MSQHTHIVGIGGAGMSAIAQLLLERGDQVSGCDRALTPTTSLLAAKGASVCAGHSADHLAAVDRLLVTSALPADHVELVAARQRHIPVLTRHDLWREWSRQRAIVAIAGTHGKTTTSAMTALIFVRAGQQPGYLIGADVPSLGGSATWGSGPLVLEADEYARTFLALTPQVAVITNLDWDHVDIYPTQAEYDAAFRQFAGQIAGGGPDGAASQRPLILCGDDAGVQRVFAAVPATRCGLSAANDWRATALAPRAGGMAFTVERGGETLGDVWLGVAGEHNVRNALLALAAADFYAIPFATAAAALAHYRGAARRFEAKGVAGGIAVFDDYAHHPTEIRATLEAARGRFPGQRIVVYFQPHTYSRLQAFSSEFSAAFGQADVVRIGAVYGARESSAGPDPTTQIVAAMAHPDAQAVGDLAGAFANLRTTLQPGDVLLTLGAGDGVEVGERIIASLEQDLR
jgi:UDP-N-acetylmuramate--alanine ligase